MKDDPLSRLLQQLARDASTDAPWLEEQVSEFIEALSTSDERDGENNLTKAAVDARQRLRNPVFNTTHVNKARGAAAANVQRRSKALTKHLLKTVSEWALLGQAKLEYELLKNEVPDLPSRMGGKGNEDGSKSRFELEMEARGVADYMPERLTAMHYDYLAALISYANKDRLYKDPANLWRSLFTNGQLEAFRGTMTDDEARLLAEVAIAREDPGCFELRDRLEARLGRKLDVSPTFAAACSRLLDRARELSPQESYVLYFATGEQPRLETEALARLLKLSPADTHKVDALVRYFQRADPEIDRTLVSRMRIGRVTHALDELVRGLETLRLPVREWLPFVKDHFLVSDGFVARSLPDADTFWLLLADCLERSASNELFGTLKEQEEREGRDLYIEQTRRWFEKIGVPFEIDPETGTPVPRPLSHRVGAADRDVQDAVFEDVDEQAGGDRVGEEVPDSSGLHEWIAAARSRAEDTDLERDEPLLDPENWKSEPPIAPPDIRLTLIPLAPESSGEGRGRDRTRCNRVEDFD